MPIPMRIRIIGAYDDFTSERTYTKHEIDSTVTTTYEYTAPDIDRATRAFYEDEETGIVTRDVERFEAWMRTIVIQSTSNPESDWGGS